jgi:arylsulfatase A-like enzyme
MSCSSARTSCAPTRWDARDTPVVETPNLDRLAASGARFRRAYCSSPVCIPTRVSMFSGLYPHTFGKVAHVRMTVDPRIRMLPGCLRDAGYRTGIAGKTHFWPSDEVYGAEHARLTIDAHLSPELGEKDAYKAYLAGQGFGECRDESSLPEEHCRTFWTARECASFIRSDDQRPFFLFCSFVKPHPPYDPPEPYASMYAKAGFPPPVAREEEFATRPAFVRCRMDRALLADAARLQDMRSKYFGLVTMLDKAVGDILDALEESGKRDDTVIVFTSDHGGTGSVNGRHQAKAPAGPQILQGQRACPLLSQHGNRTVPDAGPDGHPVRGRRDRQGHG